MSEQNQSRQIARRVFAQEFNSARHIVKDGESEMAPKFQVLPSGGRAGRVLVLGVLTECEDLDSDPDSEYWRARVVDPTGGFNVYADDEFNPEAAEVLRSVDSVPRDVAVVGKPRVYTVEDEDGEQQEYVKLDAEVITLLDEYHDSPVVENMKRYWVLETARQTVNRLESGRFSQEVHELYGEDARPEALQGAISAMETLQDEMAE